MKTRKMVRLAGLSLTLFLGASACGSAAGNQIEQDGLGQEISTGQETGQNRQGQGTDEQSAVGQDRGETIGQAQNREQMVAQEHVTNNGTGFVKRGDEIFFAAGSMLCSYQEETGNLRQIGDLEKNEYDAESSRLFYRDGWVYYEHYDTERQDTWVSRINVETGAKEAVCQGFLEGISEDTVYLFINRYEDSKELLAIYEGDRLLKELRAEGDRDATYCGTADDYVFVSSSVYGDDTPDHQILAARISQPDTGAFFLVGHMPCLNEDGNWYEYPEVTQVLVDGTKAYFSLSYYAGTGMFYNGGYVCQADLTQEDSLRILKTSDAVGLEDDGQEYGEVYLWMENGGLQMGQGLPNTAKYSGEYDGSGIRVYDENGKENLIYPGLVPPSDQETFLTEELQDMYVIDGVYYFVWKRLLNDPSQAIGWRAYYETVNTEYVRMDADGTLTVMCEEPGNLILSGYVARGSDESYLYFQPADVYEDYQGVPGETVSDTMAKVYLAQENVLSELVRYGVETFADSDVEFNGYQGYYVGTEPISEQKFLLRFDQAGKLVQIAPDYAG